MAVNSTRVSDVCLYSLAYSGIAGLSVGLGILKAKNAGANVTLDIYEAAHQFAEIGAGIAFGPNSRKALQMMGLEDALDAVAETNIPDPDLW